MRRFLSVCVILFASLFLVPLSAQACSCLSSGLPCEAYWKTSAVFSGEVADVSNFPTKYFKYKDGTIGYSFPPKRVRFDVDEIFKGISLKKIEIKTGSGGGDCGYNFAKGQKYLVYAYRDPKTGDLTASICSRTRPLDKAAEDIEYFHSLQTAKPGSTVFGFVVQQFRRRNNDPYKEPVPLSNIPVTIEGASGKRETATDAKGEYRLTDLSAGDYAVRLGVPANLWGYEEGRKIKVSDKGCAAASFALETKTILSGKLLDENSVPLPKTSVELIPVEQLNQKGIRDYKFAYTDDSGEFLFRSITNGKYYLGIRFNGSADVTFPYPQTFYPGTLNVNEAVPITISEGQILENYDFRLPQKLPLRKIEGIVVYPDGTPAANASISINETEYFYSYSFRGVGRTDDEGKFSFDLVDGIRYLAQPVVSAKDTPSRQRHAEPIEIPANGNVTNLKFVITEPNGTCQKCLNWRRGDR